MAEQKQSEEKESSCASLKMIYFGFSGRGHPLRLAAAIGGIKLEEENLTFEEQAKEKADGKRRWSGIPELFVLDKDGKEIGHIGQSNACLRYIGQLAGLYPQNPVERALCDEICDSAEDLISITLKLVFGSKDADDKKAKSVELCKEGGTLRYWLDKFALRIEENAKRGNKNGLYVGDSLTIADLKCFTFEFYVISMIPGANDVLSQDKYKSIINNINYVKNNDTIKTFLNEWEKKENVKAAFDGLRNFGVLIN